MKLRDRCVNAATVSGTNAVFSLPGRKTFAGYARTLLVYLDAANDAGCTVSFMGADAIYTTDWGDSPHVPKGRHVFSILEMADNVYLVETRQMEQIQKEN